MSNLQNNIASLEALITKANALPEEKTIQSSKTVTPTTSSQTVKPDSGYDGMGQVVVNAMPTATQATPSVSINSVGKITATATQSAGYVAAGTKTGTKQLTTQAAKTITPTKSSQTAVAKNVYTTGAVTVGAIPSQYITTTDASAAADDIVTGETAYVNGVKVTGTNPYEKTATDTEVAAQATTISEIAALLEGKSVPGGSGGNVKIYPAGEVSKGTKLGDNTLTYACPLDELDFFTMSMDKLTPLASAISEGIPATVNLIEFYDLLGYRMMLQADESYEGYYNADAIVLYMEMEEGVFYPMDAIMVKITPEIIAAEGLSIEPGIYLVHSQKMGMTISVIYTGL